jgi:F5/8 type C domain
MKRKTHPLKSPAGTLLPIRQVLLRSLPLCLLLSLFAPAAHAANGDATWFRASKYGIFHHYNVLLANNLETFPNSTILKRPQEITIPEFQAAVDSFSAATVAQQASDVGAKFVVFSLGQVNGFYIAPNNTYKSLIGDAHHNAYTPYKIVNGNVTRRDLIKELGMELHAKNIKLLVYTASEGPVGAPPGILAPMWTPDNPTPDASSAVLRANYNAMLREWSNSWQYLEAGVWKSHVDGWWIDSCHFPAYTVAANLAALVAACRGDNNPTAIVCCNPTLYKYTAVSPDQDFLAGEDANFGLYPLTGDVAYTGAAVPSGTQYVWNTTSYLGNWWGEGSATYLDTFYMRKYVKAVSDNKGVVTLDCAINAAGVMSPAHKSTMLDIKNEVRDNNIANDLTGDLLRNRASHLLKNTTPAEQLPVNQAPIFSTQRGFAQPGYGNDGIDSTIAMAGSEMWNYRVDLKKPTASFNWGMVEFPANFYPRDFAIQKSNDGLNWTSLRSFSGNVSAGIHYFNFQPQTGAEYVRVISTQAATLNGSLTPMGVSRFEMFNQPNLALNRPAVMLRNDTSLQLPVSGTVNVASNGVDGVAATYARAANDWKWTYRIELRPNTFFNKVSLEFPAGLWATSYKVQYSTNDITWTTLANITNNTSAGLKSFPKLTNPAAARYIRVVSSAPAAPGQPGVQMAISELNVSLIP